jgi:hypothetical protein
MKYRPPPFTDMPPGVKVAATLTFLLAAYGGAISLPICATGLFVGPHILITGVVHAILGILLLVAWRGLLHQRRWAMWTLLVVSGFVASSLPILLARDWLGGRINLEHLRYWLVFPILFGLIVASLAIESSSKWFQR